MQCRYWIPDQISNKNDKNQCTANFNKEIRALPVHSIELDLISIGGHQILPPEHYIIQLQIYNGKVAKRAKKVHVERELVEKSRSVMKDVTARDITTRRHTTLSRNMRNLQPFQAPPCQQHYGQTSQDQHSPNLQEKRKIIMGIKVHPSKKHLKTRIYPRKKIQLCSDGYFVKDSQQEFEEEK